MTDSIKVNSTEWNNLTKDDQERVKNILAATGLLKGGVSIMPDPNAKMSAAGLGAAGFPPAGPFCKIVCDLTQAAAAAACVGLPPPAAAVCIAAANAAGDVCRQQC